MNEVRIGGPYTSALTHFAGFGVAAILEEAGYRGLRIGWSETSSPSMSITGPEIDESTVAEAVAQHAERHAIRESWVQARTHIRKGSKESEVGLFSPRIAVPEDASAWARLYEERRAVIDADTGFTWLDGQMLQALGEPAYWQAGLKDAMPDEGASRWEMKTRNRGEDFVRNRLAPMALEVSTRGAPAIIKALAGESIDDSAGKDDSRTGTGLVTPQPVDDAVAWCGLWGISAFRLFPRLSGVAITPGAWPTDRTHPAIMAIPLSTSPMSGAKLRRIIRSQSFSDAAFGNREKDPNALIRMATARATLKRTGVRGAVVFPIRKGGSASAPERQVLGGTFEPF